MTNTSQVLLPKTAADVPGPAAGTAMTKAYVQAVGQMAYIWGWPLLNSHNRRGLFAKAPYAGPVAPVGQLAFLTDYIKPEETFVTCPNQDVVYGMGYYALDDGPIVFQVPEFGDRFWVYALYDARTDQFAQIGNGRLSGGDPTRNNDPERTPSRHLPGPQLTFHPASTNKVEIRL